MAKLTVLLAIIIGAIGLSSGQLASAKVKSTLFARNLDPTEMPPGSNGTGPVHVLVSTRVKNFLAADSSTGTLKLQMLVKLRWIDRRLIFTPFPPDIAPDNITLDSSALTKMWVPTVYYVNGIHKEMDKANQLIRIFVKTGEIEYSYIVTLTTSCPMNLRDYPHDIQTCLVQFSSYGHPISDIVFEWNKKSAASVLSSATLPDYQLQDYKTQNCDATTTQTGVHSCIQLELKLKREGGFYCVHVYIPCTMLIIISWLSYFLHPTKSATARLIVVVAALALAVVGISTFNLQAPRTSYTKSIDVWTGVSLTFIFVALIEFVGVNYLNQYPCCHSMHCKKQLPADGVDNAEQQTPLNPDGEGKFPQCQDSVGDSVDGNVFGAKVDIIFRIVIPIKFFFFAIVYWIIFV